MTNIIPFNYENLEVRVVKDDDDNLWWVAKDVCEVLGIEWKRSDSLQFLDNDEKGLKRINTLGGSQDMIVISESGLYTLIIRSNKSKAQQFRKWVTAEVLPTIRKTGAYSIRPDEPKRIAFYTEEFDALVKLAERFNIKGNQALLSANKGCKNIYGFDPMASLEIPALECHVQSVDVTPTQIGTELCVGARMVNKLLIKHGYQKAVPGGKYEPTEKGLAYAVIKDTNKKHNNGTPVTQLLWKYRVVDELKEAMH